MSAKDRPTDHIAADPEDLHPDGTDSAGAATGLDRPVPAAGPVADTTDPAVEHEDLGLEDRPQG